MHFLFHAALKNICMKFSKLQKINTQIVQGGPYGKKI